MGGPLRLRPADMAPDVVIEATRCLRRRLRGFSCSRCIDNCHAGAVSAKRGDIEIDSGACTRCGRCSVVCPAEVFVFAGHDPCQDLKTFDSALPMRISCYRHVGAPAAGVFVSCLGALSFEAMMFLALNRNGDIVIDMTGCADCENSHIIGLFTSALTRIKQLELPRPLAQIIVAWETADLPPEDLKNRRSFLVNMSSNALSLIRARFNPKASTPEQSLPGRRRVPGKTELMLTAFRALDPESKHIIKAIFPQLLVQTTCTLCPRCAGICPTGALKRESISDNKQLVFIAEKCTACGLCIQFCNEKALELRIAD